MELITKEWNKYLQFYSENQKDIYFREEYVKLYETKQDEAICYVYSEEKNYFLIPFLKRIQNIDGVVFFDFETAYGYGGPILNNDNKEFHQRALISFYNYCKRNKYIAGFIRFHPLIMNENHFEIIGKTFLERKTIAMDLSLTEDDIWMNEIHSKQRNSIRKAEKAQLEFIIDKGFQYIDDFIILYEAAMKKVSADSSLFFDRSYYDKLQKTITDSFLGVVIKDNLVISAAIFFFSSTKGHYHLSGSHPAYLPLCANSLMIYETAKYFKKLGIIQFHLGGGSNSDEKNSLLLFKSRFSKNQYPFIIGKLIFNLDAYIFLVNNWEKKFHEKTEVYKNHLLKYRY